MLPILMASKLRPGPCWAAELGLRAGSTHCLTGTTQTCCRKRDAAQCLVLVSGLRMVVLRSRQCWLDLQEGMEQLEGTLMPCLGLGEGSRE